MGPLQGRHYRSITIKYHCRDRIIGMALVVGVREITGDDHEHTVGRHFRGRATDGAAPPRLRRSEPTVEPVGVRTEELDGPSTWSPRLLVGLHSPLTILRYIVVHAVSPQERAQKSIDLRPIKCGAGCPRDSTHL